MSTVNDLTERVTIQQGAATDDGFGGQDITWTDFATVFAQVDPTALLTRARGEADQLQSIAGYRVRMRSRDDVNAGMRFSWKGHTLLIYSMLLRGELLEFQTYEEQV